MKNIALITSTRAEYGLLYPLIKELMGEPEINLDVLVSGTHLLEKYGKTVEQIKKDHVPIAEEIPILDESFESDEIHVAEAIAKATVLSSRIFEDKRYEALIVLGDRYELLGFCTAAAICRIPIIHIHGGEITEGAVDDKIRHAVTKLSSLHFPSIQEYADRIIQMGEDKQRVYPVGALGIDNIMHMHLLDRESLLKELDISPSLPVAAVTYHPVTSRQPECARREIREVLEALIQADVFSVITMPNSDVGGDMVFGEIKRYTDANPKRMALRKSLGQMRYLSLLKNADIMVGNSSSGILESASFLLPTVNIGDRQKGRLSPKNVIHCECRKEAIRKAVQTGLSDGFSDALSGYVNPYGDGNAAKRIASVILKTDFSDPSLICKKFYDIR